MAKLSRCMDAFLSTHTRLVVIVDGLDSCEQEKLLQVWKTVIPMSNWQNFQNLFSQKLKVVLTDSE